jgi:hypothetical protein
MLCVSSIFSLAVDYQNIGKDAYNSNKQGGSSKWAEGLVANQGQTYYTPLSQTQCTPLVYDLNPLDGKNVSEIIAIEKPYVRIYQNITQDPYTSLQLLYTSASEQWTCPYVYDIEDDGKIEIIIMTRAANRDRIIHILEIYEDGLVYQDNGVFNIVADIDSPVQADYIACKAAYNCLLLTQQNALDSFSFVTATAFTENTYWAYDANLINTGYAHTGGFGYPSYASVPQYPKLVVDDDGHYVFAMGITLSTGGSTVDVPKVNAGNGGITIYKVGTYVGDPSVILVDAMKSDNAYPVNYDYNNTITNVLAIKTGTNPISLNDFVVGYQLNKTDWQMKMWNNDLSRNYTFPNYPSPYTQHTFKGDFLSDPIAATIFPNSGNNHDFCIVAYNTKGNPVYTKYADFYLNIGCGSAIGRLTENFRTSNTLNFFTGSHEDIFAGGLNHNISRTGIYNTRLASSNQFISSPPDLGSSCSGINYAGYPISGFLVSGGYIRINLCSYPHEIYTDFEGSGFPFDNPFYKTAYVNIPIDTVNSSVITTGVKNTGYDTVFGISSDNYLFSIDDNLALLNARITQIKTNPCRTRNGAATVWRNNTRFSVEVKVIDRNIYNQVTANVTMYADEDYAYNLTRDGFVTSNASMIFNGYANYTGLYKNIRVLAMDSTGTQPYDVQDVPFSVGEGNDTVVYGECTDTVVYAAPTTTTQPCFGSGCPTTTVTSTTFDMGGAFDGIGGIIGVSGLAIFLGIMLMLAIGVFAVFVMYAPNSFALVFPTIMIIEALALVVGWQLGIVSTGIIVVIVLIVILIVGIWASRFFTQGQTGA